MRENYKELVLKNRISLLNSRRKDNGKIVKKLTRKLNREISNLKETESCSSCEF